ncbi:MAG TPA: flavin reductase family protein [Spirochaetota bacterium]|nr:flavin reductase family protein [Spirochaetota bacterium]
MLNYSKTDLNMIDENVFKLIGSDWMLITSGTKDSFNTMTASWGGFGVLWNKPVSYIFVRPQRYTYEFLERNKSYSLSFFDEKYRKALTICGSKSGRDIDKVSEAGLTPVMSDNGIVHFAEAKLVVECSKLYYQDIDPSQFLDNSINKLYDNDYHRMYIGEITGIIKK